MRYLTTSALIATLALLAAGCGGSSKSPSHSAGSGSDNIAQAAFKYATCMRSHGVNIADPQVSTQPGGGTVVRMQEVTGPTPADKAAQKACKDILPPTHPVDDAQAREQRAQSLVSFARCMRSHRVSDFPDPTAQGLLTLDMLRSAGVDVQAPAVQAAANACIPASHGVVKAADIAQVEAEARAGSASGGSGGQSGG